MIYHWDLEQLFWFREEVASLGGKLEAKLVEVQVSKKIFELQVRAKLFEVQVRAKLCFLVCACNHIDTN